MIFANSCLHTYSCYISKVKFAKFGVKNVHVQQKIVVKSVAIRQKITVFFVIQ